MIRLLVTQARFGEIVDLDDACNLADVNITRAYEYICDFVVDENENYIGKDAARKLFKNERIKQNEISKYWVDFIRKVNDAYVPPPSGAA